MARITWQNIIGPSVADAARPLALAGQSFNASVDALDKVFRERQAFEAGVRDRQEDARVQTYLDRLQGAQSPEELAAIQGDLRGMLAGFQDPTSRAKVRGADERRATDLRQIWSANQDFNNRKTDAAEAPVVAEFATLLNQDPSSGEAWLAANGDRIRPQTAARLAEQLKATLRGDTEFGWKRNAERRQESAETRAGELHAEQLLAAAIERRVREAQIRASNSQVSANAASSDLARYQQHELAAQRANQDVTAAIEKLSRHDSGTVGSTAGTEALLQTLGKTVAKDDMPTMAAILGDVLQKNPAFKTLPTDVVEQAMLRHVDSINWHTLDSTVATRLTEDLKKALVSNQGRIVRSDQYREVLARAVERAQLAAQRTQALAQGNAEGLLTRLSKPKD